MIICRKSIKLPRHGLAIASRGLTFSSKTTSTIRRMRFRSPMTFNRFATDSHILTLARKTKILLSRLLPSAGPGIPFAQSAEFWQDVLASAYDDYASSVERPVRVVVYGVGQWSHSEDLITALLSEQLTSDNVTNEILRNRRRSDVLKEPIHIIYAKEATVDGNSIWIPSTYLQQFSIPIQVTEVMPGENTQTLNEDASLLLLKADFPIIVVNPVTTPLHDLLQFRLQNSTILALVAPTTNRSDYLRSSLNLQPGRFQAVVSVDPSRALRALEALHADASSPSVIQRYQDDFIGSGVSSITEMLRRALDSPSEPSMGGAFRANLVLTRLRVAIESSLDTLSTASTKLASILSDTSSLAARVEEARSGAQVEIFGLPHDKKTRWGSIWPPVIRSSGHDLPKVVDGRPTKQTGGVASEPIRLQQMHDIMDSLTWWRMLLKVDEISNIFHAAVEQTCYPELEKKLIMHTGRLASTQQAFTVQTFSMLAKYQTNPPFDLAVLENSLRQICVSPSYGLTSSTLVEPLQKRKSQLVQYSTTQLHVSAQRAVVGMTAGMASSVTLSWLGWLGWLSGVGINPDNALLQVLSSTVNIGIEPTTAVGLGAFGALASIRWAAGNWERAKKRWWEDWERINHGLERDLKAKLDTVMREKVTIVAERGSWTLRDIADKRRNEIAEFEKELNALLSELDKVQQTVTTRAQKTS